MKIVADENIPFVREAFSPFGEVTCCAGRAMSPELVADAEVLLVRSVTRVGPELLAGSTVRFVGTATIGTDHVDQAYMRERGIAFADAAGSNANSVAEYVVDALLVVADRNDLDLQGMTIGIVGLGNVGSKVEKKVAALGLNVLPNDPPLQRQTGESRFVDLDTVCGEADIITCHVPLTREGPDATWHLFDGDRLGRLRAGTVLVNTARGAVVDNVALKGILERGKGGPVVLDVWQGEPQIDVQLMGRVAIATPHIAGYSLDGKANGTVALHDALCRFLNRHETFDVDSLLGDPPVRQITLRGRGSDQELLRQAMTAIYDIEADDRRMRRIERQPVERRGEFFDGLRKNYPVRREAHNTSVTVASGRRALARKLETIGFRRA